MGRTQNVSSRCVIDEMMESQFKGYRVYLSLAVILAKKRVDGNLTSRGENFDCLLQLTRSRQYPALEVQEWDKKAGG